MLIEAEKVKHVILISDSGGTWKTQDYVDNEITTPVIAHDSSKNNAVLRALNIINPMGYNKEE